MFMGARGQLERERGILYPDKGSKEKLVFMAGLMTINLMM